MFQTADCPRSREIIGRPQNMEIPGIETSDAEKTFFEQETENLKLESEPDFVVGFPSEEKIAESKLKFNRLFRNCEMIEIGSEAPENLPITQKCLAGIALTTSEKIKLNEARDTYWSNKILADGTRCKDAPEYKIQFLREEKGYGSLNDRSAETEKLQNELFADFEKDNLKLPDLKKVYCEKFPSQLEGIEILFQLPIFFENDHKLDLLRAMGKESDRINGVGKNIFPKEVLLYENEFGKERMDTIKDLSSYRFLMTHFLINNSNNREFLEKFWATFDELGRISNKLADVLRLKHNILSQAAVFLALKELGLNPKLSHPSDDAFRSVDVWVGNKPVQIKGGGKTMMISDAKEIAIPGITIKQGEITRYYNSHLAYQDERFRADVELLKKKPGNENIEGRMIAIPYNKMDPVTGKPTEDFIEFMRQHFDQGIDKNSV